MLSASIHEVDARARVLEERWQKLLAKHLPVAEKDSIWRYRFASDKDGPLCGWKLHVSATILNAADILERIAPLLVKRRVQFKAPCTLNEVLNLNSGLIHAYSQVGKVITVYPRNDREAIDLAQRLHKLTYRFKSPSVPFDLRLTKTSNIYYRYGAFKRIEIEQINGARVLMMPSPNGDLVPDVRERARPVWAHDPFEKLRLSTGLRKRQTKVNTSFQVLRALVQRGKGGVYQAVDLGSQPPRLCLLKEGRRRGEIAWDGRDGAWRVKNEERVLLALAACGLTVPKVYARFEVAGNLYLAMEFIDGESLHALLLRQKRRLPIKRVLTFGIQVASLLEQMHQAGWAWRDCKPKNLIVTHDGKLMPIDFEGASPIDRPDSMFWGTRGFVPPEWRARKPNGGVTDDLYALGSILYLLLTGRLIDEATWTPIETLRQNVPIELRRLIESLLGDQPARRPAAKTTRLRLNSILSRTTALATAIALVHEKAA